MVYITLQLKLCRKEGSVMLEYMFIYIYMYYIYIYYICNSYTMGTSAFPDIYTQARGPQAQVCIYRQSTSARGITNM